MDNKFFKLEVDNGTNFVLQVKKEKAAPMVRVVVDQKRGTNDENQWWHYHVKSNTLRTKTGDFCLDIDSENNLRVNPWCEHAWTQKFAFVVQSLDDRGEALQVVPNPDEAVGRTVNTIDYAGTTNQLWAYDTAHADASRHFFMLRNIEDKAVMRIGGTKPETPPIVGPAQTGNTDGQLWWYEPAKRTIQCKSTEYSLEAQNKFTFSSDDSVATNTLKPESAQQHWRFLLASTKGKGIMGTGKQAQSRVTMTGFNYNNDDIAFKIVHN